MQDKGRNREKMTDRMILIGIVLGGVYWVISTFLYVISSDKSNFLAWLFNPNLDAISTRIIVLCLFLIFGSHIQYASKGQKPAETDKKHKQLKGDKKYQQVEAELEKLKEINEKLQQEIQELKKALL